MVVLVGCLLFSVAGIAIAEEPVFNLDIPAMNAAEALNRFAEQTGAILLFPYDLAQDRRAKPVSGQYTLLQGLELLLRDTGLSGGLSDRRVIRITSVSDAGATPEDASSQDTVLARRSANDVEGVMSAKKSNGGWKSLISGAVAGIIASVGPAQAQQDDSQTTRRGTAIEEIIVTAQKREERIQDVPLSITAFSEVELERRGIDDFYDYARLVPGLAFTDQGAGNSSFFIRGVASPAGNPTTQFYIDDMPQLTSNAASTVIKSADPAIFDVSRIEILRGPQGTLFGASAMGGMIRVITNKPDSTQFESAAAADVFITRGGDQGLKLDGMVNVPLIEDKLAIRLVGSSRDEGGWIDRVPADYPGLLPGELPREFAPVDSDIDDEKDKAARVSALYTPTDALSLRASIFWQEIEESNRHTIDDVFGGAQERAGTVDEPREDRFTQYNFTLEYALGAFDFISSTSYLDRYIREQTDFTFLGTAVFGTDFPYLNERVNPITTFTTEARIQTSGEGPLSFTVGGFYLDMDGGEDQIVTAPGFSEATGIAAPNDVLFDENTLSTEKRTAAFGQASYRFSDSLELLLGLRWFDVDIDFFSLKDGLFNGGFTETAREISESGTTPKVALKFDFDDNKQVYASASKGFRVGSPNFFVPQDACGEDLAALGFDEAPELIESDSLWQYEIGTKVTSEGGRFVVNGAAYYTDWTGIPQNIPLNCGFSVSLNVGEASSTGFELELWSEPVDGLDLQLAIGYVDAQLELDAPDVGGEKGDQLQQVPEWTVAVSGQYTFPVLGDYEGFVRGDYSYIDDSYTTFDFENPNDRRPDYQIADFQVGVMAETWEGALYIENAFDEVAILGINPTDVYEWTVNRPRTIGFRVRKSWN